MNKQTNEDRSGKERPAQKLGALLLEGVASGTATPFTKAEFEAIKNRGLARLKAKRTLKNPDRLFADLKHLSNRKDYRVKG